MTLLPMKNRPFYTDPFSALKKTSPFDTMIESLKMQQAAPDPEIIVNASNVGREQDRAFRPEPFDVPERPTVEPQYVLNDNRVPPHPDDIKEIVPRKGMFGVKGTLRDVLGTLGDAFLVGSGKDAMYRPVRQREQAGDALMGFTDNPLQAIERLAAAGHVEQAQELYDAYQTQQIREAQQQSLDATRQSQNANRDFDNREKGFDRLSRWAKGGMPYERLLAGASLYGLGAEDLAQLGITPDMSPQDIAAFASGDMTVNQQETLPRRDRQLDISQQNADSQRISATRPRAAPQPRAMTDSERYVQIMDKPANQRSAGERAWAERYREGTRGSNRGRRSVPNSTSSSSRFRILN